jgi:hypothetical protein
VGGKHGLQAPPSAALPRLRTVEHLGRRPAVTRHDFTADEIADAVAKAIHDHEFTVIPGLIRLLALNDPQRAQDILDTIELGLAIGAAHEPKEATE